MHERLCESYVEFAPAIDDPPLKARWLLHISDKSTFGERHRRAAADDEVIQDLDVDERQRALQGLGKHLIGLARFGDAGWMLGCVRECHPDLRRFEEVRTPRIRVARASVRGE